MNNFIKVDDLELYELSIDDEIIYEYINGVYIPKLKIGNKFYYGLKVDGNIIKEGNISKKGIDDRWYTGYREPEKVYTIEHHSRSFHDYCTIKEAINLISKNNNIINREELIKSLIDANLKLNNEKIDIDIEKLVKKNTSKYLENKLGIILYDICNKYKITLECQKYVSYGYNKYFIDYYIPEINLAIEMDEYIHKFHKEEDKCRQDNIVECLGCRFYRIYEIGKNKLDFNNVKKELDIYIEHLCKKFI